MNIVKLSYKNIIAKPLQTFLTVLILSLSIGLLLGVKQLNKVFESQLQQSLNGVDMVVGAKGSPLQLVLSTVLHIDNPTGNISYNQAKKIAENKYIENATVYMYADDIVLITSTDTFEESEALLNTNMERELPLGSRKIV